MQPAIQVDRAILRILYKKCAGQELTTEDERRLEDWLVASSWNREAMTEIMDDGWFTDNMAIWEQVSADPLWERVQQKIADQPPVVKFNRNNYRKWMYAAAASLLLIGSASLLLWRNSHQRVTDQMAISDVAPGGNTARLTLADGSTILLDSVAIGKLTQQGNVR